MSKLKHYFEKGTVYHVTTVTKDRTPVFHVPKNCHFMMSCIAYHRYMLDFQLIGYVIMPDHIHLLIQPSDQNPLNKIMQWIKGNFARKFNQFHKKQGHVWQESYYETQIRKESDIIKRLNYMHNNPVRKGLTSKAEFYEFSSARQYLFKQRQSFQILVDKNF